MLHAVVLLALAASAPAATLDVGPNHAFARIEDANAQAQPGDVILVHSPADGRPYPQVAVLVRQKGLTFRAAPAKPTDRVALSGEGFAYTGSGRTPRAIFQFEPGADDCVLEGFDLSRAHNASHNGAGVRINQANHIRIRDCIIHDNDMGIMSNGDGTPSTAVDQRIENCVIHHNGDPGEPGQNHNLYLGGTSVTLSACAVHHSLTGHNVKSRAHHTRVEYCYIHDSANREFDLVDAGDTQRPDSDAVLMGNVIVKDPKCAGNRGVIHFGQDGGRNHRGTLYLAFNTITTPFISPVVDLSAPDAKAILIGNLVTNVGPRQSGQQIAEVRKGAKLTAISGAHNWFCGDFARSAESLRPNLDPETNRFQRSAEPLFRSPEQHDYSLTPAVAKTATVPAEVLKALKLPPVPGMPAANVEPPLKWQYHHLAGKEPRTNQASVELGAVAQ